MKPLRPFALVRTAALFAVVAWATLTMGFAPLSAQPGDPGAADDAIEGVLEQIEDSGGGLDLDQIDGLDALGPNPWLSLTANRSRKAVEAWNKVATQLPEQAKVPRGKAKIGGPDLTFTESEAVGETGVNDTVASGDKIPGKFGTDPGDRGVVTISGSLSGGVVRPPIDGDCEDAEDDGSISLANPTPAAQFQVALCVGEIGNGPFGDSSGDIDFYSYGEVEEGTLLILDTAHIAGSLDPVESVIGIYDADGNLLVSGEDSGNPNEPEFIEIIAPSTGEYFGAIAACCELSSDPNDSSSGPGATETGTYELFVVAFPPPCSSSEDDGSIGLANDTLVGEQGGDFCLGVIGDGPYGDADTDVYSLGFADAGFEIIVDVFAFEAPVETVIGLYDADGNLVASAEDSGDPEGEEADFLQFIVETPGDYFAAISGCCELQGDPNDPASGVASDQAGPYEVFLGNFAPPPPPCESVEDDGAIPLANEVTGFDEGIIFVGECFGAVGDGPQAEANGDVDFFRTRPLEAGRILLVDFADFFGESAGAGDLTIAIYNESGELLATGQDDPAQSGPESDFFSIVIPEDGVYYVAVGGAAPDNPFDETSGTNTDIVSGYSLMFIVDADEEFFGGGAMSDWSTRSTERPSVEPRFAGLLSQAKQEAMAEAEALASDEEPVVDADYFVVHLNKGDAIAGGFDGAREIGILDPAGVQRSGSQFNPSFIYPASSPLRHDRFNGFDHVATVDGPHAVFVSDGVGEYEGELRVVRSGLAGDRSRDQQVIFLDFDGATLPGDTFGTGFDAEMSPLSAFLERWDLTAADEDAVIDATIDAVVETLDTDLRVRDGRNGDRDADGKGTQFDVEILNSRDHGDRWGEPNVSRVIIGGTIEEVQIPTIGIAQSIDPGNLETEETAIVLLDVMSEPAAGVGSPSINSYDLAEGVTKAEFVGFVVGNITSHEIGHYIGNWHQETFNEILAIMDAGGDFPAIAGVGDDGVYGTADDNDPDFVEDVFNTFEGFNGVEDTAGRSVFGLSTGSKQVPRGGGPR